jgi:hypothetical protein
MKPALPLLTALLLAPPAALHAADPPKPQAEPNTSLASAGGKVPVALVNYSKLPVHATAITLDEQLFRGPVRVRRADNAALIPLVRGLEDGRAVLRLFVSLPPASRLDLVAEPAERWSESRLAEAKPEKLRNGVVRVEFGKKGWRFGFEADKATLIEDGQLDFWVDDRNRGRIMNSDPNDLGLVRFATAARVGKSEVAITPDGRPVLTVESRLDGIAKDMSVMETFELVPGMPLLVCRVRWRNDGDKPLWIAYAGSGDGIRGRWSKELLSVPLIERKKSPIQGDINGSETRCAWLGALCRISMESPASGCGVGMSTLLPTPGKVGQGSMIWGCGASGFQCNFIDPAQGQFPFLVKPHSSLMNGFVFLAAQTEVSVFRQTADLWKALQSEKLPKLPPPCAVFVGGEAVHAQTIGALETRTEPKLALRLDFNKHFECLVTGATKVVARPLAAGKKSVTLLETNQAATLALDLNQRLGWSDEVPFVLETSAGSAVSIAETLPVAPKMLSPIANAVMTDIAAMFRWCAIPMVVDYHLQWARTPDFAAPTEVRVASSHDYPWHLVPDDQLPAPGKWYWRIRGMKSAVAGVWSETRAFTINNDHSRKPLKRPLTARAPLFTLEATRVLDYTQFHPDVPADIAPFVGIIAEGMEGKGIPVTEFARGMEEIPHAFMLRSHWVGLADIEWLFQHVPNFVGIQGGEHLSSLYRDSKDGDMRYHHRLTRLCAKYGMFFQEADGTYKDDKWQELMDQQGAFVREFGPWLVLSQKNNIIRRQFYSQSAALGLWLGGITAQHGAWEDGGFYWQNAGFNELGVCAGERSGVLRAMPRIFWTLNAVMGMARGCGIYSLDGQTVMDSAKLNARDPKAAWASAIWDDTGKTTDTFHRFVVPLIRSTVQHALIPTKEQLLANVKLAVFNDRPQPDVKAWPHYAEYGPLFAATYGFRKMGNIDGQLWEFFPNTGRYYFIPVLVQGNEPLGPGVRNLGISQLQDVAKVREIFNAAYPATYEGDAFVIRVGHTITVLNSRENEDVAESFSIPLPARGVGTIAGKVGPHAYVVAKIEDHGDRLWLQANSEYPERDTVLALNCPREPGLRIEPRSAVRDFRWDDATKTLHLRLSHGQGAVEVEVKQK